MPLGLLQKNSLPTPNSAELKEKTYVLSSYNVWHQDWRHWILSITMSLLLNSLNTTSSSSCSYKCCWPDWLQQERVGNFLVNLFCRWFRFLKNHLGLKHSWTINLCRLNNPDGYLITETEKKTVPSMDTGTNSSKFKSNRFLCNT